MQKLKSYWLNAKSFLLTVIILGLIGPIVLGILWLTPIVVILVIGGIIFFIMKILMDDDTEEE